MELPEGLPRTAKYLITEYLDRLDRLAPIEKFGPQQIEELRGKIIECLKHVISKGGIKGCNNFLFLEMSLHNISSELDKWSKKEDNHLIARGLRRLAQDVLCLCDRRTAKEYALKYDEGICEKMKELEESSANIVQVDSIVEIPCPVEPNSDDPGQTVEDIYSGSDGIIFKVEDFLKNSVTYYVLRYDF